MLLSDDFTTQLFTGAFIIKSLQGLMKYAEIVFDSLTPPSQASLMVNCNPS